MIIYTVQLAQWRKVKALGLELTDTTVKSGHPEFAPSWDMVLQVKQGSLSEADYRQQYIALMKASFHSHRASWEALMAQEEVVIGCYCKAGTFCHRYILQEMLLWLATQRGLPVTNGGEIS